MERRVFMRKVTKITAAIPAMPKRKRVAGYGRVSVNIGERPLQSLSAQVSYYSEYIQKHPEWEYAGVYADLAKSGTSDDRSEFQRMLTDCEAGKIDIILTKSISRFARNTVDLLEVVRRLKEIGVEVRFEREGINSMSGEGELMLTILASFAQEESRSLSENVKWGIRKGFQEGKQSSTLIYGYRWDGENLVVHPEEAEIVRYIFAEYLAEKSPYIIIKQLTEMGAKAMYGGKFNHPTILSMLQNEKYIGRIIMQKTFVEEALTRNKVKNNGELSSYIIENAHPAIIDCDTFDKVQARLQGRKIAVQRTVFTSKIFCSVCGLNFQRCTKHYKGTKTKVMQCANKKHGKQCDCDTREIPESILEKISAEVLGLSEFDGDVFLAKVKQIVVPSRNQLVFHLSNGKTITREWESTARTDCWTPERRAAQGERAKAMIITEEIREKRRIKTTAHYAAHPERRQADSDRMKKFCAENPEWGKKQNERMIARIAEIQAEKKDGGKK
jgi:DNA invertase Pin-like site-specific DNA recombinase